MTTARLSGRLYNDNLPCIYVNSMALIMHFVQLCTSSENFDHKVECKFLNSVTLTSRA